MVPRKKQKGASLQASPDAGFTAYTPPSPQEYGEGLSPAEAAALATLEAHGWEAFREVKVEDLRRIDNGSRLRTFRHQGRYAFGVLKKG